MTLARCYTVEIPHFLWALFRTDFPFHASPVTYHKATCKCVGGLDDINTRSIRSTGPMAARNATGLAQHGIIALRGQKTTSQAQKVLEWATWANNLAGSQALGCTTKTNLILGQWYIDSSVRDLHHLAHVSSSRPEGCPHLVLERTNLSACQDPSATQAWPSFLLLIWANNTSSLTTSRLASSITTKTYS